MKIFVTGGTGLLGKHLINKLSEQKHDIVCLVRYNSRCTLNESGNVKVVRGDLLDAGTYKSCLNGIDVVYNCAAVTGFWGIRWRDYYLNNVEATKNLLRACCEAKVPNIVHVSTTLLHGPCEDAVPRKETDKPGHPLSGYEKSKLEAESVVMDFVRRSSMNIKIVRLTSIYCAEGRLIPLIVDSLLKNELKLIGPGSNKKHITHVNDCVDGIILAAAKGSPGSIYNIGAHEVPTMGDIIENISSVLGKERPRRIPRRVARIVATVMEAIARISGKQPMLTRYTVDYLTKNHIYDTSLAEKELGFKPKMGYREGIELSVRQYLKQKPT